MEPQVLETLVLIVHIVASLAIIGLVLIQHGKGADMGSGFGGGASGTVFGSSGAGSFLSKVTTYLAIGFFVTSFGLAIFAKDKSVAARDLGIPAVVEQAPLSVNAELPALDSDAQTDSELPVLESDASALSDIPETDAMKATEEKPQG